MSIFYSNSHAAKLAENNSNLPCCPTHAVRLPIPLSLLLPLLLLLPATSEAHGSMSETIKRARGCLSGTKNKPRTKNVGRPRKDGQPTRVRSMSTVSTHTCDNDGTSRLLVPVLTFLFFIQPSCRPNESLVNSTTSLKKCRKYSAQSAAKSSSNKVSKVMKRAVKLEKKKRESVRARDAIMSRHY